MTEKLDLAARAQFTIVDYAILILLMLVSLIIGVSVGIKGWNQTTTKDFLMGGRKMHPIPVSMSLVGGVLSAISVLGNPTEMYFHGTQLWLNIVGCFWGTLVVMFLILPTLYPLDLVSVMQYLELRFASVLLKKMGSVAQMVNLGLFLGICLYAPSIVLSSVTNLSTEMSICIVGFVCAFYISIGGVKAVVYTDVVQTSIMFFGILAVIVVVCIEIGGLGTVFSIAQEGGRLEFFNFDPNPLVRHSFWSVQVLGMYFIVSEIGISQPQFQRLNSVATLRTSQGLCLMFYVGVAVLWSLFYLSGLVAYAAYADCDPLANKQIEKPDQIIPFLVADKLSRFPGMSGLFVAAVYGAVLSSVSSTANAFAALIWEDFLCDWKWFTAHVPVSQTNVTRLLSAAAGTLGVALAFLVGELGTLFQVSYSVLGAFVGPVNGIFVTAISAPWVNEKGAVVGFISAFVFNVWLVVGQFTNKAGRVAPLPVSVEGCSAALLVSRPNFTLSEYPYNETFTEDQHRTERDYPAIYDLSYCYLGTIGVLIVFTVSSIVSFITGPNTPYDVHENLVHKPSLKVYKWLWDFFHKEKLNLAREKEESVEI